MKEEYVIVTHFHKQCKNLPFFIVPFLNLVAWIYCNCVFHIGAPGAAAPDF